MTWCPKCKCEYREGFTHCSDCGSELVDVLESQGDEENKEIIEGSIEAFLTSVTQDFDAKIIESKLTAFGIPSLKKTGGVNGVYGFTGTSNIDIYVPHEFLDKARALIDFQLE